jgi:hypothetical protein
MVAVLAISAVAAGSAQALRPTWRKGGVTIAVGTKLLTKDSSWKSRLWSTAAGLVIQCEKDTSKGSIENVENAAKEIEGVDTASVTYEGCQVWSVKEVGAAGSKQWAPKENLTTCKVRDSVKKEEGKIVVPEVKTFLAYVPGSMTEVVDVSQPKTGTMFVTLEIFGASCALATTAEVKGSVIGKIPRVKTAAPQEEGVMGDVLFETTNEPRVAPAVITQRYPKYELVRSSGTTAEDVLTFGTHESALESTEQIELESEEPFGVRNEP